MLPQAPAAAAEEDGTSGRLPRPRWKYLSARGLRLPRAWRSEYALLAGIIVIGAALRFFRLGQWSFWEDEIFTINAASNALTHLSPFPPPALSTVLTGAVLRQLETTEWTARLVSAAIGVLSIPVLYAAIRGISNTTTALVCALLLAFAPWHIAWSQNARFYTSLLLFYTLAMLAFFQGMERNSSPWLCASLTALVVATGERLTALLFVPVMAGYVALLWLLNFDRPAGWRLKNLLPWVILAVVVTPYELYKSTTSGHWLLADFFITFLGNPIKDPARLLFNILYNLSPPVVAVGLVSGIYLARARSRLGLFLLIASILPIVLLELMSPFVFVSDRYAFITLVGWLWLTALGLAEAARAGTAPFLRLGVVLALLAASLQWAVVYYTTNDGDHADWRSAFSVVRDRLQPGDVVVSTWPEVGDYYLHTDVKRFGQMDPQAIANSGTRHWFVVDPPTTWTAPRLKEWMEMHGALVTVLPIRAPDDQSLWVYVVNPAADHP